MTYTVSGEALNPTYSLTDLQTYTLWLVKSWIRVWVLG